MNSEVRRSVSLSPSNYKNVRERNLTKTGLYIWMGGPARHIGRSLRTASWRTRSCVIRTAGGLASSGGDLRRRAAFATFSRSDQTVREHGGLGNTHSLLQCSSSIGCTDRSRSSSS